MVPGPGGNDHEGNAMLARDRGDECLGTITARHAKDVSAARDGVLGQLTQIVARPQHDWLDAALPTTLSLAMTTAKNTSSASAAMPAATARATPRRDRMYHAAITVTPRETTLASNTSQRESADTAR